MDRSVRSWDCPYAYDACRHQAWDVTPGAGTYTDHKTYAYDCWPALSGGVPVESYTYGPHGECSTTTGVLSEVSPHQFSAKWHRAITGFHYYGFRYYCPSTGRWLNRDPIGEDGGINLYGYVGNNPIFHTDPLGLAWYKPWSWNWTTIGSAIELKGGGGPGLEGKVYVGPVKITLGAEATMVGGWLNFGGGFGGYQSAEAGLAIDLGKLELGFKKGHETKFGYDECHKEVFEDKPDNVFLWKMKGAKGDSANWFKVGAAGHVLILRGEASVDFKRIWEGITE